jgi:pilus assembly protein TadC
LAASLAVVAAALAIPARGVVPVPPSPRPRRALPVRVAVPVVAGLAASVLVGGWAGVALGVVVLVAVRSGLPLLETSAARTRREAIERQAPLVIDLVAACLASGAPLDSSLVSAARAVGAPTSDIVLAAVEAMRLGADVERAWSEAASHPALAGVARAVVRAADSGAPLAEVLPRLADRARAARRATAEARVRAAGVRLTAPLGLAFLPAFVLLGVVPVVAAWVSAVL